MSVWATSELSKKFGGFNNIEKVMTAENPNLLDDIFWLMTTLANAAIMYRNIRLANGEHRELLPNDYFQHRVSPLDVTVLKEVIFDCINNGLSRKIESEDDDSGNAETE
jgi:hypothetical protein